MAEDGLKPVLLQRLRLLQCVQALGSDPDEDHAAIVGHAHALDEAPLLHPVHDPRGVAERDVEELGEAAHREVTVMLEQPHHVHVRHAHAGLHQTARAGAAESRDHVVEALDDPLQRFVLLRRQVRRGGFRCTDTSHDRNNLATVNNRVNHEHCPR
jgi:hypothetical protein